MNTEPKLEREIFDLERESEELRNQMGALEAHEAKVAEKLMEKKKQLMVKQQMEFIFDKETT